MKVIKRYLDNRLGEYSFYFEDINSKYTFSINENVKMISASCIKVPIAMVLLKKVENGDLDLNSKILVSKEEMVDGAGIIHEFSPREYSINELLTVMLVQSDNTATNKIIDLLEMDEISKEFENLALTNTKLNRKMRDEVARESGHENYSSSFDLSMCFKVLYKNTYLSLENSNYLLDILRRQQIRDKIPFYIPEKYWPLIANKTGSLEFVENDTCYMSIPKGDFIFTVMSQKLPSNVYGIATISRIGEIIWDILDKSWN